MSLTMDTSDTIMSICRRNRLRVLIRCSGSRWMPTQQPFTNILVALYNNNWLFIVSMMSCTWGLTLKLLMVQSLPGSPYSTLPETPRWGWVDCQRWCRPSRLDSLPNQQHDPIEWGKVYQLNMQCCIVVHKIVSKVHRPRVFQQGRSCPSGCYGAALV